MKALRVLLPLAAVSIAAFGQPPAPSLDNIKTYLSLTDTVIASIQAAEQKARAAIQPLEQTLADKQKAVDALLSTGSTDAAAIGKAVLEVEAVRTQIKAQRDALQSMALSYLTAAQKAKLTALEDAAKLLPAIQEAGALHLIATPAGAPGRQGVPPGPRPF